ncbi:ankyrin repeat and MYND domain-containing protein 1-like [Pararge aegeria]|nr:ankyrin repeat and MYND domain-containing protein 1-like [Pararge aegeria]
MSNTTIRCPLPLTHKEKTWEYQQYYLGEKDEENRKCGEGQHHWSGAKSLECYTGNFIRDTMHGFGDYRWRYQGPENACFTYEGHFYCNRMNGYGTMSYSDGRTFYGLFFNNVRWGPGIQSHADVREDVGLWRFDKLVRLAWRPEGPSVVPEFINTNTGRTIVESHRIVLATDIEIIGEANKAIELLKKCGADPRLAAEKWSKVYPKYCTDLSSPLCYTEAFDWNYYKGKLYTLKEVDLLPEKAKSDQNSADTSEQSSTYYYAWNNNNMMLNMMKHSFKHEKQRCSITIDLNHILSGYRKQFKSAGEYEINCRTFLMAAFLDHIENVAQLVNEKNVNPDVSDAQGNSAIMYATVGDQPDVIHFLVEAGANVDFYNDGCCTPLGMALMRYVCTENDVPPSGMLQALLPPSLTQPPSNVLEWNMTREQISITPGTLPKSPSKSNRSMSSKKIKSLLSIKDQPGNRRKAEIAQPKVLNPIYQSDESISEDKTLYNSIHREFSIKITDMYTMSNGPVQYFFDVTDMIQQTEIDAFEDDRKKIAEKSLKNMFSAKNVKDARKTSKEIMWQQTEKEEISITSAENIKSNKLTKTMSTILQLLSDGANPRLVRCPQPALLMAVMSNSPDLIRHLVHYGADINEKFHQVLDYTPLDVAVSRLLSYDNLEMVRVILESGANAQHRIIYNHHEDPKNEKLDGPTLLHVVLAKKADNEIEEDIRLHLLELLLQYNCSPITFYKGRSALDVAMCKSNDILNIIIKSPKTDLNSIINTNNQSILVKMFSFPYFKSITSAYRLQLLTDLLLFGADPLLKCQNCEETYQNIFVITKQIFYEMERSHSKTVGLPAKASDTKVSKKAGKLKKDEKSSTKTTGKSADDVEDYRQAVDLVTECARLIYIRWLQSKLMKELIVTIDRYKHRHWYMILKSCQGTLSTGLWISPQRCLEIWDILSDTKKRIYNDKRIMTHALSIVLFLSWQNYGRRTSNVAPDTILTTQVNDAIEADVSRLLLQHKADKKMKTSMLQLKLNYVKPELVKDVKKFDVCFECIQPLNEDKILCTGCKQIFFCSYDCMKSNVDRSNCHPCSDYLKIKYFSSPNESYVHVK